MKACRFLIKSLFHIRTTLVNLYNTCQLKLVLLGFFSVEMSLYHISNHQVKGSVIIEKPFFFWYMQYMCWLFIYTNTFGLIFDQAIQNRPDNVRKNCRWFSFVFPNYRIFSLSFLRKMENFHLLQIFCSVIELRFLHYSPTAKKCISFAECLVS